MKILFVFLSFVVILLGAQTSQTLKLRQENSATYESDHSKLQRSILNANHEVNIDYDDESRLVIETTIEVDVKDKTNPGKYNNSSYSNFSKPLSLGTSGYIELRELYFEKYIDDTLLKIGKMQNVWGKADGLKLIDKLNPQDYSQFILPSFEDSRIPLWSISSLSNFENSEFEIIWIPDTTYANIPSSSASYAFTTSRIIPSAPDGASVVMEDVDKPNHILKDSDIALKYLMMMENMEVGFYYLYFYEDNPVLYNTYDSASNTASVQAQYERSHFLALSFDYAKGDFVYRVETGFTKDKYFLNDRAIRGIQKSDEFAYVFGIDWYGFEQSLLSVQFNQVYILSDKGGYNVPKVDNTITLLYKKDLMNDTLFAEVLMIHNLNDNDGLIRPKLSYELDVESMIHIGLDKFYGDEDGLYGEFREQSRFTFGYEQTF